MSDNEERCDFECASEMLIRLKGGKTPSQVRKELKAMGYTTKQISAAADELVESSK